MGRITIYIQLRVAASILLISAAQAFAQMSPDEHAQHHAAPSASTTPSGVVQTTPTSPVGAVQPAGSMQGMAPTTGAAAGGPPAAAGGMAGGMDDMMKGMGTPPQKEVYPTLMALPDGMTPEDRDRVARLSQDRMKEGTASLSSGLAKLSDATSSQDYPAMQQATVQMHAGLADFESGIAGQRVVTEGQLPRNVALGWFRREMNLASPTNEQERQGLFGVSPIHLFTMVLLVLFALAMVAMYFFKMRRAAALFGRLDPDNKPPSPGPPPSPPEGPKSFGPTSPPSGGVSSAPSKEQGVAGTGSGPPTAPEASSPSNTPTENSTTVSTAAIPSPIPAITAPSPVIPSPHSKSDQGTAVSANWKGRLRVASIIVETPNVKTFRLTSSSTDDLLPFTFIPGQFLNVAFWIGGAKMNRSYSISSSPNERQYVDLTIRREPRGAVSRHIDDLIRVGSLIETSGPVGKFTFTGAEADSIVLLSGGVGITPMMSITRYLTENSWPGEIYFLFACRTPADIIFADKMPSLEYANPRLHVAVAISSPAATDWTGFRGRITKEWLTETVPDLASRRVHLCGPVPMMDSAKALLAEIGLPSDQLKTEAFGLVKPAPAAPGSTRKPVGPATGPTVTFSKNDKSAKIHMDLQTGDSPPRQTILELSEELGIGIEFSCRVGTCGICKVKMTSGEVDMEVQDALDADDKSKSIILACQAKPKADVTVEA